ncbi:MAG TPA: histidine phosphatase family protein [Gaiellaceae bacterium]|jgi:probable phosphoglycerate mutase|nr:histidine phosphatase family protein [Gaiellaceae bacterium]
MTMLIVARHGQTDWNAERRWQGHADPPLNDRGRAEAAALAESLAGAEIEAIHSSDLARARETAAIVAERLRLPLTLDARLREVDVGEWSGLTTPEIERLYPGAMERRRERMTGWTSGEPMEAMGERVVEALLSIREERALVVTHGGPLRFVWAAAGGGEAWVNAGNCDVDSYAIDAGRIRWLDSTRGGLHQQVQG